MVPTDIEILNKIFDKYYDTFKFYLKDKPNSAAKIYIPIDIAQIAKVLKVDVDIVFGRLYYDVENKYSYKNDENDIVYFFALRIKDEIHCVNFPMHSHTSLHSSIAEALNWSSNLQSEATQGNTLKMRRVRFF
jgi:hypothetical protein